MSRIIHKIEQKIEAALHIGHKDAAKHHKCEDKAEEFREKKVEHGGHREQLKELMHKVKKKVSSGGKKKSGKKKQRGGNRKGSESKHEEGKEEEQDDEEDESESESESDSDSGGE